LPFLKLNRLILDITENYLENLHEAGMPAGKKIF